MSARGKFVLELDEEDQHELTILKRHMEQLRLDFNLDAPPASTVTPSSSPREPLSPTSSSSDDACCDVGDLGSGLGGCARECVRGRVRDEGDDFSPDIFGDDDECVKIVVENRTTDPVSAVDHSLYASTSVSAVATASSISTDRRCNSAISLCHRHALLRERHNLHALRFCRHSSSDEAREQLVHRVSWGHDFPVLDPRSRSYPRGRRGSFSSRDDPPRVDTEAAAVPAQTPPLIGAAAAIRAASAESRNGRCRRETRLNEETTTDLSGRNRDYNQCDDASDDSAKPRTRSSSSLSSPSRGAISILDGRGSVVASPDRLHDVLASSADTAVEDSDVTGCSTIATPQEIHLEPLATNRVLDDELSSSAASSAASSANIPVMRKPSVRTGFSSSSPSSSSSSPYVSPPLSDSEEIPLPFPHQGVDEEEENDGEDEDEDEDVRVNLVVVRDGEVGGIDRFVTPKIIESLMETTVSPVLTSSSSGIVDASSCSHGRVSSSLKCQSSNVRVGESHSSSSSLSSVMDSPPSKANCSMQREKPPSYAIASPHRGFRYPLRPYPFDYAPLPQSPSSRGKDLRRLQYDDPNRAGTSPGKSGGGSCGSPTASHQFRALKDVTNFLDMAPEPIKSSLVISTSANATPSCGRPMISLRHQDHHSPIHYDPTMNVVYRTQNHAPHHFHPHHHHHYPLHHQQQHYPFISPPLISLPIAHPPPAFHHHVHNQPHAMYPPQHPPLQQRTSTIVMMPNLPPDAKHMYGASPLPTTAATTSTLHAQNQSQPEKRDRCAFCKSNGERETVYLSHSLRDPETRLVVCPQLRKFVCPICGATGDNAHTQSYCPKNINSLNRTHQNRTVKHLKALRPSAGKMRAAMTKKIIN